MNAGAVALPSGKAVFLREYGAGDPILILHGLLGSGDNWHPVARALAATFRVLVPDARNHGRSFHDPEAGYPAMARDARELLHVLSIPRAAVLGHSMGGKTAMYMACQDPSLVQALIVADMAPREYAPRHEHVFRALRALPLETLNTRAEADAALARLLPNPHERAWLLKNLVPGPSGGYRMRPNVPVLEQAAPALRAALPPGMGYPGPTLFLRGAESDYVRDADREDIRARFPRSVVVTLKSAGHWVQADAPDAVTDAVGTFLRGIREAEKSRPGIPGPGTRPDGNGQ